MAQEESDDARLARIETKIDFVLVRHEERLLDHEVRLRSAERIKYGLPLAFVAAVGAGVVPFFVS